MIVVSYVSAEGRAPKSICTVYTYTVSLGLGLRNAHTSRKRSPEKGSLLSAGHLLLLFGLDIITSSLL